MKLIEFFRRDGHIWKKRISATMACIVVFVTVYAMVLPAITLDWDTADEDDGFGFENEDWDSEDGLEDTGAEERAAWPLTLTWSESLTEEAEADFAEESGLAEEESPAYTVTAVVYEDSGIPRNAALQSYEIKENMQEYEGYYEKVLETLKDEAGKEPLVTYARFFDISFMTEEGETEPDNPVTITIDCLDEWGPEEEEDIRLIHFDPEEMEEPRVMEIDTQEWDGETWSVTFSSDAFSVYGLVRTSAPDPAGEYLDIKHSLLGGDSILLSDLLETALPEQAELQIGAVTDVTTEPGSGEAAAKAPAEEDSILEVSPEGSDGDYRIEAPASQEEDLAGQKSALKVSFEDGSRAEFEITIGGTREVDAGLAVISSADGIYLPEEAEGSAEEVAEEDLSPAAAEAADAGGSDTVSRVFDISLNLTQEEQEAYAGGFLVNLTLPEEVTGRDFRLYHIHDGVKEELAIEKTGSAPDGTGLETVSGIQFVTGSFSEFVLQYTVDLYYELDGKTYYFSIPGGGCFTLGQLAEVLGITGSDAFSSPDEEAVSLDSVTVSDKTREFLADVESVEFSDPDLVWAGKVNETATVGEIKNANDLDCEYSAELTEEQIDEINRGTVEAGDWALISMLPFMSKETLTVTMKDGNQFVVKVTDGQIKKTVIGAKGDSWEITVTYGEDAQIPDGSVLEARLLSEDENEYIRAKESVQKVNNTPLSLPENKSSDDEKAEGDIDKNIEDSLSANALSMMAFDISIVDPKGNIVEPKREVAVKIALKSLPDGTDLTAAGQTLEIYHITKAENKEIAELVADAGNASEGTVTVGEERTVAEFVTESFSVYTVKWGNNNNQQVRLHFVDESGTELSGVAYNGTSVDGSSITISASDTGILQFVPDPDGGYTLNLEDFTVDGKTLSSTHRGTSANILPNTSKPNGGADAQQPHSIIENQLHLTDDGTLQYRYFYTNSDKAGSTWMNVGYRPKKADNDSSFTADPSPVYDGYYDYYLVYSPLPSGGTGSGGGGTAPSVGEVGKSKTLQSNDDGTYTMDLSVTTEAKTKQYDDINIVLVLDTSSSMRRDKNDRRPGESGYDSTTRRMILTAKAIESFVNGLKDNNTTANPDAVEMALITFNKYATTSQTLTNSLGTITDKVWALNGGRTQYGTNDQLSQGTNWADGLRLAANMSISDDDPTFVLFLTDGAPSQYWTQSEQPGGDLLFVDGEGCYLGAREEGRALASTGRDFYGVFSFGTTEDVNNDYLGELIDYSYNAEVRNNKVFYAEDGDALLRYLNQILEVVKKKIGHTNVNYYDGIALDTTSTALKVNTGGNLGSITYSKVGGTSQNYTVTTNPNGTIKSFTVGGAPDESTGKWVGGTSYTGAVAEIEYKKVSGGTPVEGGGTTPITTTDATAPVYQCVVETGDDAGTYNMPIATLVTRDTNGDGKTDVGDLNWDLSPLGMLEDGATYKISFVVWPDQEAYDYVADLNNGKKEWNKDTQIAYPEGASEADAQYFKNGVPQYPNIVYNPTTKLYEVLTNTSQEVTYYIEDQISGGSDDDPYSGIYTTEPEQPNPMPLTSTKTDIEKAWGVNRNPSTLAQLLYDNEGNSKNFSINYAIIRGDSEEPYMEMTLGWDDKQKKYIWEEDSVQTVFLDNDGVDVPVEVGTRWSEDFAITTGLMLSETQMLAHGLDTTGANYPYYTYKGTKYYILEPGYDYTIEEIVPDYAESWLTYEFDFIAPVYHPMLVDGKLKSVTFKMDQGEITGISDISRDDWRVSLEIENTLRGYINLKKIVVGKDGTTLKPDDETKFTYHISMANYATKPGPFRGDSIPWYGVNGLFYHDSDYNYYQAETHTDNNKAYSFELKAEDGTVYQAHCADQDGIFDEDVPGPTAITYTKGEGDDAEEVSILLFGNEMNMTDSNNVWADLRISQKEELSIANVPNGTRYTITEAQQEGYDVKDITREVMKGTTLEESSTISGRDTITAVIVPDRDNNITFKNRERSLDVFFDKVDGNGKALPGAAFTLYSDETCETIAKDLYNEDLVAVSKSNGKVCFGEMANGTYYMKETAAPEGYEPDETVYKVVVTAGSGQSKQVSITKLDAPEEGEITQIANPKKEITLSVEKTWLDADGNEIVNTDEYSATFTAHRKMTYTTTEMQGEEPEGYATLKIGFYYDYYSNGWRTAYGDYNPSYEYTFPAGAEVKITYDYKDGHNNQNYNWRRYRINRSNDVHSNIADHDTITITMPSAGRTTEVHFYDNWYYQGYGSAFTSLSAEPVINQVPVEVTHENEEDESFHPTLTLSGGNTSGTFEGTFPVEETKEGVTYYYTYYITEEPVDGFMTTPSVSGYSNDADLEAQFINQKIPNPTPIDVDVDELPEHHKELTENYVDGKWDGTYTLSLDVTGKAASTEASSSDKADVILVLDMSSSMTDNSVGGQTRFEVEKAAVKAFGGELLSQNESKPDSIRLTVMTFGTRANDPFILNYTDKDTFQTKIQNDLEAPKSGKGGITSGGEATNWEEALQKANQIQTRSEAETFVIFISDGLPTVRMTADNPLNMEATLGRLIGGGVYGPLTDKVASPWQYQNQVNDCVYKCFNNAKDEAYDIVHAGKQFYAVSVFEDITIKGSAAEAAEWPDEYPNRYDGVNCMKLLTTYAYNGSLEGSYPSDKYLTAQTSDELTRIFNGLIETASKAIDFRNVKISDPLTAATKTTASIEGQPVDFKYWKVEDDEATKWEDAPAATFDTDTGTVNWDLTSIGALENDVTYRVTFTVWPNQDAYDAVLKLNEAGNDHEKIAQIFNEYSDIADQIIKDPDTGKYRIYSNGDATLKYTPYTSTDGGEPVPGEEETLYYPRPTMETLPYTMKVAKIWNDSIFPNHRVEKVKFDIKEDNEHYYSVILDARSQSARDPNVWEAEIPVSPGIESDQVVDGLKLNEGHVYTVTESFLIDGKWVPQDYHYEFNPEGITPLLLNGEMGYEGDANGDKALTGTNNARGSVTIKKVIVDQSGNEITENLPDDAFTFKITLYSPGADLAEIKDKTAENDDAVWYNMIGRDGNVVGEASVINSGDTFTLKAGESLRLINVPIGIRYKVEEVSSSIPDGFEYVSTAYTYKTGSDGTEQTQAAASSLYTVISNSWHYVTVRNKISGSLDFSFSKVWLAENTNMNDIRDEDMQAWAAGNTITVVIKRTEQGEQEPDRTFSLTYVIDSGAGPFKPTNTGMSEEDRTKYQLVKTTAGKITTFTMTDALENISADGKAYTYFVAETAASGRTLYNAYYGSISEGTVVRTPDVSYAGDGKVIINLEYSGYELPSAGGPGTGMLYLLSTALMGLAGAGLVMKRRRREAA